MIHRSTYAMILKLCIYQTRRDLKQDVLSNHKSLYLWFNSGLTKNFPTLTRKFVNSNWQSSKNIGTWNKDLDEQIAITRPQKTRYVVSDSGRQLN